MPNFEMIALDVCSDCLQMMANGEAHPDTDWDELCARQAAIWSPAEGWELVSSCSSEHDGHGESCDGEGSFSWSTCDGCGCHPGGDRHCATAMRPAPAPEGAR